MSPVAVLHCKPKRKNSTVTKKMENGFEAKSTAGAGKRMQTKR